MDPLAAVGLAGTIVQFVDFASKIVSKTRQLQSSASGTLDGDRDTKNVTEHVQTLAGRLQQTAGVGDPVLDSLCAGCEAVAEELLAALTKLEVKGKPRKSLEAVRKAIRSVWSREKINDIEKRLAGFRDGLNLHVTVQLRTQIDALSIQHSDAYKQLDDATKKDTQHVLEALRNGQDLFTVEIQAQTDQLKALHQNTQRKVIEEFELARVFVEVQHEQTRLEIASAVDLAAVQQQEVIKLGNLAIEERQEQTRLDIVGALDREQEIIRQDVVGIRQGLLHLHVEMERLVKELKETILEADRARKDEERKMLQKKGNSISVILMSLRDLYRELQNLLGSLLQQAKLLIGPIQFKRHFELDIHIPLSGVFSRGDPRTGQADNTRQDIITNDIFRSIASSLKASQTSTSCTFEQTQVVVMYYAYYYQSCFSVPESSKEPGLLKAVNRICQRVDKLPETIETTLATSPEHYTILSLAKETGEVQNFVWLMAAFSTALDSLPSSSTDSASVFSVVFGQVYSLDRKRRRTVLHYVQGLSERKFVTKDNKPYRFWSEVCAADTILQNRCELGTVRGKRLIEDIEIWKTLATMSGLRDEIASFLTKEKEQPSQAQSSKSKAKSKNPEQCLSTTAQLACFLFEMFRFSAPCRVAAANNLGFPILVSAEKDRGVIWIDTLLAPLLWTLVQTLHHIGVPLVLLSETEFDAVPVFDTRLRREIVRDRRSWIRKEPPLENVELG